MQKAMCKLCGARHNRHEPHQFEPIWVTAQEPLIDTEPPASPKITIASKQTFTVAGWPTREELRALPDETLMRVHNAYRAEVVRRQRAEKKK